MLDYKILYKKEEILDLASYLLNFHTIVFDLETTGLDTHTNGNFETVGFGFCVDEGKAFYIPVNSFDTHGLTEKELWEIFKDILENESIGKVGQNIKYDARVCARNNIKLFPIIFDTMLASYCLYSDRIGHGLDDQSLYHFNIVKTRTKEVIPKKKPKDTVTPTMKDANIEIVANYCMEDVDFCYRLYKYLKILLHLPENDFAKKIFYSIELPLLPVLIDMECDGIKIDEDSLDIYRQAISKRIVKYNNYIEKKIGKELEITKPAELAKILYEELKIDKEFGVEVPTTKSGQKTTSSKILDKLKGSSVIRAVQSIKKLQKLINTYLVPLPEHLGYDGLLHPSFSQSTSTGRLACKSPNIMQIPSRDEKGRFLRRMFISRWRDIGGKILAADMSQAELRIMAHISRDETLVKAYTEGVDVHDLSLSRIENKLKEGGIDIKLKRSDVKVLNFGMIYGMGPTKLSADLNIPMETAVSIVHTYLATMTGVKNYLESNAKFLSKNGYVETLKGRRRYIPKIYSNDRAKVSEAKREGGNMPVQGTNADMIKEAMILCSRKLKSKNLKSKMIMQVHDELVFDVFPGEEEVLKDLVKDSIIASSQLIVPMQVGLQIGVNWSEAH